MPMNGAYLNRLKKEFLEWYPNYRQRLLTAMEQGEVYGARQLTTDEQVSRFIEMTPEDYKVLLMRLQQRYAGLPDADSRINRDLATYMSRMTTLLLNRKMMPEEEFQSQLTALQQTVSL